MTKCMKIPDSVELEKEAQRSNCAYGPATELDMQFDDGSVLRNVNLATLLTKLFALEKLAFCSAALCKRIDREKGFFAWQ